MLTRSAAARVIADQAHGYGVAWLGIGVALLLLSVPPPGIPVVTRVIAPAIVAPGRAAPPAAAGAPGAPGAPKAPVIAAPVAAVGLTAAAAALAQAQRTGTAVPVTFSLSQQELTAAAARAFPQTIAGMTLSDPVIHLVPGSAQLVAITKMLFVTTELAVATTPAVAGGRVVARLDSATLGGVGLPDAARGAIVAAVESAIAQVLPAKLQVTAVTVTAGVITFQGNAQP